MRLLRFPSWEGNDDSDDMPNEIQWEGMVFDPDDLTDSEDADGSQW